MINIKTITQLYGCSNKFERPSANEFNEEYGCSLRKRHLWTSNRVEYTDGSCIQTTPSYIGVVRPSNFISILKYIAGKLFRN